MLLLGGLASAFLLASANSCKVQCTRCLYIFRPPPLPRGPLDGFALQILQAILFFGFVTVMLLAFPGPTDTLSRVPLFVALERFVVQHPRALLLGMGSLLIVVTCLSLWAFMWAGRKHRREFSSRYLCQPTPPEKSGRTS